MWGRATRVGLVCALVVAPGISTAAHASPTPRLDVLAPITVSGPVPALAACAPNGDDNTPQLAVDPAGPRNLVLTYYTGDDRAAVAARSTDTGRTWTRTALPGLTECTGGEVGRLLDPDLAFAPDGTLLASPAWMTSDVGPTENDHQAVRQYVSRSLDGGATWEAPVDVDITMPFQRGYLANGPRGDLLVETETAYYNVVTYTRPGDVHVLSSTSSGKSWTHNATIPVSPGHGLIAAGLLRTGSSVVALVLDVDYAKAAPALAGGPPVGLTDGTPPETLEAAVSTDGGRTFSAPAVIAECGGGVACMVPSSAVGPDGSLVVSYTTAVSNGTYTLRIARSVDGGRSWQQHVVAQLRNGADLAAVAVGPDGIGVLALERRDAAKDLDTAVLHVSSDGGSSWRTAELAGPFDTSTISYQHWDGQLGPAMDIAVLPGGFGVTYPVLKPFPLVDGEQDVVFQRVLLRGHTVRPDEDLT